MQDTQYSAPWNKNVRRRVPLPEDEIAEQIWRHALNYRFSGKERASAPSLPLPPSTCFLSNEYNTSLLLLHHPQQTQLRLEALKWIHGNESYEGKFPNSGTYWTVYEWAWICKGRKEDDVSENYAFFIGARILYWEFKLNWKRVSLEWGTSNGREISDWDFESEIW